MPGPVEPRLLKRAEATKNYLVASVFVGILTSGLVIAQAWLLARAVAIVFTYRTLPGDWLPTLALLLAIFAARGLLAWVNSVLAHRSAAAVKSRLRRDVLAAHLIRPVASSATLTKVTTTGLDALDGYFSKYLPQLGLAASVPFLVGGVLLLADWPSALIVAFTLPLVPVFMALIGWTTQAATRRASTNWPTTSPTSSRACRPSKPSHAPGPSAGAWKSRRNSSAARPSRSSTPPSCPRSRWSCWRRCRWRSWR